MFSFEFLTGVVVGFYIYKNEKLWDAVIGLAIQLVLAKIVLFILGVFCANLMIATGEMTLEQLELHITMIPIKPPEGMESCINYIHGIVFGALLASKTYTDHLVRFGYYIIARGAAEVVSRVYFAIQ